MGALNPGIPFTEVLHALRAPAVANVPEHTVEVIQFLCMKNEARAVG
jgi:hypothetical protein